MQPSSFKRFKLRNSRIQLITGLLVIGLLVIPAAQAQQCEHATVHDRPTIGLALGGGGARGGAHIGVLKLMEELRVPVDYIAGTSMGSIVGGLMATGMNREELEEVMLEADWADLFEDNTQREDTPLRRKTDDDFGLFGPKLGVGEGNELLPAGAVAGHKITFLFESLTSQRVQTKDFDQLPIPFRAVAADIILGDVVVLDEGDLSIAMRSSMSVPGAFDPVRVGDDLLVDGGIVRNLPVDVVREMGAEIVIAVSVGTPLATEDKLGNLLSIVLQLSSLMVVNNTNQQIDSLGPRDILISPELGDELTSTDFEEMEATIPIGYAGADKVREQLSALSVSEEAYRAWRQRVESCVAGPPQVQFVRVENNTRFADEIINDMIHQQPGDTLDLAQLDADIRQIYGLGFIRHALYRVVEEDGEQGILIKVEEDPRGTDYIETGLDVTGKSRNTNLNVRAAYLKTDLDERGSEFRLVSQLGSDLGLLAEYYRPSSRNLRWIFRPQLAASRIDLVYFDEALHPETEYNIDELAAKLVFGREFGRHAGLFASVLRYSGNAEVEIGAPGSGNFRYNGGEWSLFGLYDRLDNRYVPSEGSYARLQYSKSDEDLGADNEFEQVKFTWFSARTWDRHTGWIGTIFNTTLDDNAPKYAQFSGGGFLGLSGFERNQLVGQHFGASLIGYRYQMIQSGLMPGYLGATLEYGNATDRSSDVYGEGILNGSIYMAYDSPIGPLYLGMGFSEDHSGLVFLRLGTVIGGTTIGRR